jgi:hypothetical protein
MPDKEIPLQEGGAALLFIQPGGSGPITIGLVINDPMRDGEDVSARIKAAIVTACIHHPACADIMTLLIARVEEQNLHRDILEGLVDHPKLTH